MLTKRQIALLKRSRLTGGNRLATAKTMAGLTQTQIAARTGLPQSYISRLQNGHYRAALPGETMRIFATLYGCAIEDLFPRRSDAVGARP
jgi:transcriptional regulator with XRE-family HTH domain